jgi:hypothetical protein
MSQLSFDDFLNRVRQADNRLINELVRVLHVSALKMERHAKMNATFFPKVRTGRLRSSITGLVDSPQGTPRIVMRAGGSKSGRDVDYANYVEFGTVFIRPRLFMGRAVDREQSVLSDQLANLLDVALDVD